MDGWLIEANVFPLYFLLIPLKKSDNLEQGNLISKTDAFISFLINNTYIVEGNFYIFRSSETISAWATEVFAWNSFPHPNELVLETIMYNTCMF